MQTALGVLPSMGNGDAHITYSRGRQQLLQAGSEPSHSHQPQPAGRAQGWDWPCPPTPESKIRKGKRKPRWCLSQNHSIAITNLIRWGGLKQLSYHTQSNTGPSTGSCLLSPLSFLTHSAHFWEPFTKHSALSQRWNQLRGNTFWQHINTRPCSSCQSPRWHGLSQHTRGTSGSRLGLSPSPRLSGSSPRSHPLGCTSAQFIAGAPFYDLPMAISSLRQN